jgi:hypothetical protein
MLHDSILEWEFYIWMLETGMEGNRQYPLVFFFF